MAINNTGAMFKSFEFDGTDSRDFGVYITGAAVYDAPEREVEMLSIPNRNGAFALDKGRFENIEITYPAGIYADTEADFAEAISDLRNFLCSKRGYCRLTDEYNPNEYRMAIYKSGLEVEPALLKAGEFEITFECKPQRYLTSGESAVSVADGGTITNPTLFDSNPLISANGYGTIDINGYEITIDNTIMGAGTQIHSAGSSYNYNNDLTHTVSLDTNLYNAGDTLTIGDTWLSDIMGINQYNTSSVDSITINSHTGTGTPSYSINPPTCTLNIYHDSFGVVSTNTKTLSDTLVANISLTTTNNTTVTGTVTLTTSIAYASNAVTYTVSETMSAALSSYLSSGDRWAEYGASTAYSSVSILGNPTYMDCDLGEVYMIKNGSVVGLNSYIDLGSDLPKLSPGSNAVTYDNTVTDFKVTPRWWKV